MPIGPYDHTLLGRPLTQAMKLHKKQKSNRAHIKKDMKWKAFFRGDLEHRNIHHNNSVAKKQWMTFVKLHLGNLCMVFRNSCSYT